jgi:hypothetical protein
MSREVERRRGTVGQVLLLGAGSDSVVAIVASGNGTGALGGAGCAASRERACWRVRRCG